MRLAIVGMGKMGRACATFAEGRGHTLTARLGNAECAGGAGLTAESLGRPDVVVEFTRPEGVVANLLRLVDLGLPVVTGTTGWDARRAEVEARVAERGGTLLAGANFSIGLQLYLRATEALAAAARGLTTFDAALVETHHTAKRDAPSGTALLIQTHAQANDPDRPFPITSLRVGSVPGTHRLLYDGPAETIDLVHTVRDRTVFAEGAIHAAEWLVGRKGVFTFADSLFTTE
ncbi:MAG: 4-hydroxy-tetrahydrodipicolinate reductase [Lacipirellulaceae bacterium]